MPKEKMQKNLILAVDDNGNNLQVVGSILRDDYRLAIATNGEKALKIAAKVLPDLILLDIMMPEMDGYEVCRRLKADPKTAAIPVIFLTARAETDDIVRGFELGGVDYITKPFKKEELFVRIKTHLELKHSKEKIAAQAEQLAKSNRLKDRMFSIIGHDLRGPIGNLKSLFEFVLEEEDQLPPTASSLIRMAKQTAASTYTLLENLLLWARSQRNETVYRPENIQLSYVAGEMIDLLKAQSAAKKIDLSSQIPAEVWLHADANMLRTILRNLISNAIKFTPAGGKVQIKAEAKDNVAEISVSDNGVGISDEVRQKLFKAGEAVTTYGTDNEKGSGLGLKICRDFVKMHGGEISVQSTQGKGTTFSFAIPLQKDDKTG